MQMSRHFGLPRFKPVRRVERPVSTEPSCGSRPVDFASLGRAYWSTILFMAGVLILLWFDDDVGPGHPVYALILTTWTFLLGPGVAIPVILRLPRGWFRVPAGERVLHRALGVEVFGWLLDRSGYNRRFVYPMWEFPNTRAGLLSRAQAARGGASAHGACFAIHMLLAAVALFTGYRWGALWILLPGVVVHLYPVLLQRSIMLRLQPLLDRVAVAENRADIQLKSATRTG
jgi:hypothetical protein